MSGINEARIVLANGQTVVMVSPVKCPCGATARRIRPPTPEVIIDPVWFTEDDFPEEPI